MKRRCSAPLTDEDYEIFLQRWSELDNDRFFRLCRDADRRDAELMLQAQMHPLISGHFTASGEHVVLRSNLASLRRVSAQSRHHYLNLRRYALRIGGTTLDWPDWPEGDPP